MTDTTPPSPISIAHTALRQARAAAEEAEQLLTRADPAANGSDAYKLPRRAHGIAMAGLADSWARIAQAALALDQHTHEQSISRSA